MSISDTNTINNYSLFILHCALYILSLSIDNLHFLSRCVKIFVIYMLKKIIVENIFFSKLIDAKKSMCKIQLLNYSTTQLLNYSTTQLLNYSTTQLLNYSTTKDCNVLKSQLRAYCVHLKILNSIRFFYMVKKMYFDNKGELNRCRI